MSCGLLFCLLCVARCSLCVVRRIPSVACCLCVACGLLSAFLFGDCWRWFVVFVVRCLMSVVWCVVCAVCRDCCCLMLCRLLIVVCNWLFAVV